MAKLPRIGGQAVLEGVMMRGCGKMAIAVRGEDGKVVADVGPYPPPNTKVPFVRGVFNLVDTFRMGMGSITRSARMAGLEDETAQPSKFESWLSRKTGKSVGNVMMTMAVVLAVVLAVGLFFVLPNLLASLVARWLPSALVKNLVDGCIRMLIFLGYMSAVSLMKDIKRFFAYHGAEHKTINCFEKGETLTIENIQRQSTANPRCGTGYLLVVMVISIVFFSFTGWTPNILLRMLIRLALLPVVAAVAYELLMLLSKSDNWFFRALRAPGMALQRLTTRQPDDAMVEVARASFAACLTEEFQGCLPSDFVPAPAWQAEDLLPDEEAPESTAP